MSLSLLELSGILTMVFVDAANDFKLIILNAFVSQIDIETITIKDEKINCILYI